MGKEKIYCKCGCEEEIKEIYRKPSKKFKGYIKYHHLKVNPPNKGKTFSEETKKKISEAKKGFKLSKEHIEKLRKIAIENNPMKNEESRDKIRKKLKGRRISVETRRKQSEWQIGRKLPKTTRDKISKNNSRYWLGRKKTQETIDKIKRTKSINKKASPMKGKKHSLKTREKFKEAWKKRRLIPISEETKKKLSKSHKIALLEGRLPKCIGAIGDKNPRWLGGKSFEPYDSRFNHKFKKEIKKRDNRCMLCNISIEDLRSMERQVHIHHINYDKKLSIKENCICLCNQCHSITNTNRDGWIRFFQSILSKEYNYNYNENMDIIIDLKRGLVENG
jgi:hypothetical protein